MNDRPPLPSPRTDLVDDDDASSEARLGTKITVGLAFATLLIHLVTNGRYGYFRDELYYIACSRHLASGYVDMAPLCAWTLRLQSVIFGESLFALRLLPAIAGALTVALTGCLTRELGGRWWATALACVAAMAAPIYLGVGNFYSMNVFEPLFWMGCIYLLARIINGASPRLWLAFGLTAGLGVENKHSFAFFGVGIVVALLATPERRHLVRPWIWLGGVIALAVALPNILWQVRHHWATLELLRNVARSDKNVVLGPGQFIAQQILIMNPAALPLWLGGLLWLLLARDGRRYRLLGIAYLVTLFEFIVLKGKHYYLAPVYPMLFAAGGVAVERFCAVRFRWIKPALVTAIIAVAALVAPTVLPILPPEKLLGYMRAIHFEPPRTEKSHTAALPQLFADQFGWEELVRSVARAYQKLAPADQSRVAIFCQNYGQAGAVDFFGPGYGLPPAICGHQNYYLWGPRDRTGELMLIIDSVNGEEREQFQTVEDLGVVESSPWAMPWEQRQHLFLCHDLKVPLAELWPKVKEWL
ncbi:MAG: glycosyltransferase family 39 protein [Verrucomicrobiota bacterium]|nr:glycosyltransferase family 39 protein [Verrucomicrobiota bacterium]